MSYQQISDIQEAIAKESRRSARPLQFRIRQLAENKIFLYLELDSVDTDDQLSPQLEDCAICWNTASGSSSSSSTLPAALSCRRLWDRGAIFGNSRIVSFLPLMVHGSGAVFGAWTRVRRFRSWQASALSTGYGPLVFRVSGWYPLLSARMSVRVPRRPDAGVPVYSGDHS